MPENQVIEQAQFTVQPDGEPLAVHFNPQSLQYTVENTLDEGADNAKKQFVSKSTGKLTMELVFDTTGTGVDVRTVTEQIARFMEPDSDKVPPVVLFEWGTYTFQGMVDSFKETLDFFAPGGIPLRSSVSLSMTQQDEVFAPGNHAPPVDTQGDEDAFDFPAAPSGQDATSLATQAGDARAGRAIATANGLESMRFPSGSLTVSGDVSLSPPAAFASGGVGGGFSAGFGAGASAGLGGGASAGFGAGASAGIGGGASASFGAGASAGLGGGASAGFGGGTSASFGAGASASFGSQASAGVSASGGAFAGLRSPPAPSGSLNVARLSSQVQANLPNPASGSVQVSGKASTRNFSGLSTDVGANADLTTRIQFDAR